MTIRFSHYVPTETPVVGAPASPNQPVPLGQPPMLPASPIPLEVPPDTFTPMSAPPASPAPAGLQFGGKGCGKVQDAIRQLKRLGFSKP